MEEVPQIGTYRPQYPRGSLDVRPLVVEVHHRCPSHARLELPTAAVRRRRRRRIWAVVVVVIVVDASVDCGRRGAGGGGGGGALVEAIDRAQHRRVRDDARPVNEAQRRYRRRQLRKVLGAVVNVQRRPVLAREPRRRRPVSARVVGGVRRGRRREERQ